MPSFTRAFPQVDPRAQSMGLINWNYPPEIAAVTLTVASQTIYFSSIYLPGGVPVGNLFFWIAVAGVSAVPSSVIVGLDNGTSVVSESSELKNSSSWTTLGFQKVPITSFTPPVGGYYRVCYWQNGSWGTALQIGNRTTTGGATTKQALAHEPWGTGGTSQTTFPAVGSALPSVLITSNAPWVGAGA